MVSRFGGAVAASGLKGVERGGSYRCCMIRVIPGSALSNGQSVCHAFELLSYVRRESR